MIAERYFARTNVRKHNRSKNAKEVLEKVRNKQNKTAKTSGRLTTAMSTKNSFVSLKTFNPSSDSDQMHQLEQYTKLEPTFITI